jgi:hypothetical protein
LTKTFSLLGGAMGLDFNNGANVRADRRGRVVVSDAQAAEIRGSAAMKRYDAIIEVAPMRPTHVSGDRVCPCGYAPWKYQHVCPKCGSKLEK